MLWTAVLRAAEMWQGQVDLGVFLFVPLFIFDVATLVNIVCVIPPTSPLSVIVHVFVCIYI